MSCLNSVLSHDIDVAEDIHKFATEQDIVVDTLDRFYKEFREAILVPKLWDEEQSRKTNSASEFFTYKARLYSEVKGIPTQLITFEKDGMLHYGLFYRDFLIAKDIPVDFYQDIELDYFLMTVNALLDCPWKYVRISESVQLF